MSEFSVSLEDVHWVTPTSENNRLQVLRFGISRDIANGWGWNIDNVRAADGWSVNWGSVFVATEDEKPRARVGMVFLAIPDWPSSDHVAHLLSIGDAEEIARDMLHACSEAKNEIKRRNRTNAATHKRSNAEEQARRASQELTKCAAEGCRRSRSFFADGVGYCKRHADQLGIRPKGKA